MTITLLKELPQNFDEFVAEIAPGVGDLYGREAGAVYRETARQAVGATVAHPSVDAFAAMEGDTVAGMLFASERHGVAQCSFLHVLRQFQGQGIEKALVREAVTKYRGHPVEGIVSECICFADLDVRRVYADLGFEEIERWLMAASLRSRALAPVAPEGLPCAEDDADAIANVIVDAYQDHPGYRLHAEVRGIDNARAFVQSAIQGGFGTVHPGYVRLVRRGDTPVAAIIGCEVAPGVGFVLHVAVRRAYQKQGIGQRLVRELAERFRLAGLTRIALGVTASSPARALYERLGFRRIHTVRAFAWWR